MSDKIVAPKPLTEKMRAVLSFLAANEGSHFVSDIAAAIEGATDKQINPVCTVLVGRGLVAKGDKGTKKVVNKKGLEEIRSYQTYFITDSGLAELSKVAD